MSRHSELLTAALHYAGRGWPVLPLRARGKEPDGRLVPHGLRQATCDPRTVRRWWAASPEANVGIRTGEVADVLDIDGPGGLDVVTASAGSLACWPGPVATTGKGWHLYMRGGRLPTRVGVRAGVDVRGRGGYVVAPPSLHPSGRRYRFVDPATGEILAALPEEELPDPPAWALELCSPRAETASPVPAVVPSGRIGAYARVALEEECARVAATPPGGRNHRLNVAAFCLGTLVGAGALEATVVEQRLVQAAMVAGLPEAEARRTVRSGLAAGIARPRQISGPVPR